MLWKLSKQREILVVMHSKVRNMWEQSGDGGICSQQGQPLLWVGSAAVVK